MFNHVKDFIKSPLLLLLLIIIPTFSVLLKPGYFSMHDDLQAIRLFEINKCIQDTQIPCRWVPDMGYGYGYPQFNYYGPLPYYIMESFHLSGLGYLDSVKAGFILSVILSAIGMYLLGKDLWGKAGGFISALFYSDAPYRAVDMYVRGAVGEFWAMVFLPFIFWSARKVILGNKKDVIWFALSLAGLFASHNITVLIFMPALVLWVVFLVLKDKLFSLPDLRVHLVDLFLGFLWGFFLSSFFLLPAWFEKGYAHVETLLSGYFNYLAHFVSIGQLLFSTYWAYGASELGPYDEIFLSPGILHWILPLLVIILALILHKKHNLKMIIFFVALGWLSLFLTHQKSVFIWNKIGILAFLQFPWRFLILTTFAFATAAGAISEFFTNRRVTVVTTSCLLGGLLIFYGSYFRPSTWLNITDTDKFSGELWQKQITISIFDYLPIFAKHPPASQAPDKPTILTGKASILAGEKKSNLQRWKINVDSQSAKIELPLFYFPGWEVRADGKKLNVDYNNELGLVTFDLSEGQHEIISNLRSTPIQKFGNGLSLIGFLAIPAFVIVNKRKR